MRLKHYSFRTEQTYCDWVERFYSPKEVSKERLEKALYQKQTPTLSHGVKDVSTTMIYRVKALPTRLALMCSIGLGLGT